MSDEIILKDGRVLTPMDNSFGLSIEQGEKLIEELGKTNTNWMMQQHKENLHSSLQPSLESVEKGRQSFIDHLDQLSHQNAEETAQAIKTVPTIEDKVISALSALCGNKTYNFSTLEDPMNDYVRDMLAQNLNVRDQTHNGISENSESVRKSRPGELDAQVWFNGRPIGIYEGLRPDSSGSKDIYEHISKAIINYNPQGLKEVFVAAYVQNHINDFGNYWKKFSEHVKKYDKPPVTWDKEEIGTGMSAVRGIHGIYQMDGQDHNLYVFAVKIQR